MGGGLQGRKRIYVEKEIKSILIVLRDSCNKIWKDTENTQKKNKYQDTWIDVVCVRMRDSA